MTTAYGTMASVLITKDGDAYKIRADTYEAVVANDGHLTNLRVGGAELLMSRAAGSKGSYFMQQSMVDISTVTQTDSSTIIAGGSKASIAYSFTDTEMTWKLANKTDAPMKFEMIMDPGIKYAVTNTGRLDTPFIADVGGNSSWIVSNSEIDITGGTRLWGPWANKYQVWEASLNGSETREVTFSIGPVRPAFEKMITNIESGRPADYDGFSLYSPENCQVFQRQSRYQGTILISGHPDLKCDSVEYRLSGKPLKGTLNVAWRKLTLNPVDSGFFQEILAPAGGWYKLDLRARLAGRVVLSKTIEKVGLGEVFVTAGQSNSTNNGQFPSKQTSGMVSCFSGSDWEVRDDPFIGPHDHSAYGSAWPSFGDAMYRRYHVPIGVAPTGQGNTSVAQWIPGGELFNWTMSRIYQLGPGGFRAVLWHQGEADANTDPDRYYAGMQKVINASKLAAGWDFPWFTAQATYHTQNITSVPTIRSAQKKLWDTGVSLEGPDTDSLTGDYRDFDGKGIHFSPKGLKAHGELWAEKVAKYLDVVLDK
jgi:hypothetical protein